MELFNKFENKYYSLIEEILNSKEPLKESKVREMILDSIEYNDKSEDFLVELIGGKKRKRKNEGDIPSGIYKKDESKKILKQKVGNGFPILLNNLEKQAVYSLATKKDAQYFLEEKTIEKIKNLSKEEKIDIWDEDYIKIKNQDKNGDTEKVEENGEILRNILSAIINKKPIKYNLLSNEDKSVEAYPYKVEYSLAKDKFIVIAYLNSEDRFIRIGLDNIKKDSLEIGKSNSNIDLDYKFEKFNEDKEKSLVLSISSQNNNVERCFSMFSYYERTATYMKEDDIYILEIKYNEIDQPEIIKDIVSLGDGVLVLEPENIRNIVIEKVRKCVENYNNL